MVRRVMIEVRSGAALAKSRERGLSVLERRAAEEREAVAAAWAAKKNKSPAAKALSLTAGGLARSPSSAER